MGCKITFSPQALSDLEAAVRFIARENPDAAVRFGDALIDRVAILDGFSTAWPSVFQTSRRAQTGLASLHHFLSLPRAEKSVDILRYWHGAQREPDPGLLE